MADWLKAVISGHDVIPTHDIEVYQHTLDRILQSDYYTTFTKDQTIVIDSMSDDLRGNDFGGDKTGVAILGQNSHSDVLKGTHGNDLLLGGGGRDELKGSGGNDILDGGVGNDKLQGGAGADVFVFAGNWGSDVIVDYEHNIDHIEIRGPGADPNHLAIAYNGGNAVVTDGGIDQITILGAVPGSLSASDFLFA